MSGGDARDDDSAGGSTDGGLVETALSTEQLLDGKLLKVWRDDVRLPDGTTATREYIRHPGAVMIIPLFDDGTVLLERQFRYPVGQVMVEFPAGKLDAGEDPLVCAQRELREETGYAASTWTALTRIHPVISYSTEAIALYLAQGLTPGERELDAGEFLETFRAPLADLLDWIRAGQVTDVKTVIGAFWAEKWLSGAWRR